MKIHTYILIWDRGFAPNPFRGYCTLGPCVPNVRKAAEVDDWVLGLGSKTADQQGLLLYAMRVDEILTFTEYFEDRRFQYKKPIYHGTREQWAGDNIYQVHVDSSYSQSHSTHSFPDGEPNWHKAEYDFTIDRVLIAKRYAYYGVNAIPLPPVLTKERYTGFRGLRTVKDKHEAEVVEFLKSMNIGSGVGNAIRGEPSGWHDSRFAVNDRKPFVADLIEAGEF